MPPNNSFFSQTNQFNFHLSSIIHFSTKMSIESNQVTLSDPNDANKNEVESKKNPVLELSDESDGIEGLLDLISSNINNDEQKPQEEKQKTTVDTDYHHEIESSTNLNQIESLLPSIDDQEYFMSFQVNQIVFLSMILRVQKNYKGKLNNYFTILLYVMFSSL